MMRVRAASVLVGCLVAATSCLGVDRRATVAPGAEPGRAEGVGAVSKADEKELRARWPSQLGDVWLRPPALTFLRDAYLASGNPFPRYLWAHGAADCAPTYLACSLRAKRLRAMQPQPGRGPAAQTAMEI